MAITYSDPDVDTDETTIQLAALTPTDNGVIIGNGSAFVVESGATLKTSLGLTIGVDVQAYDADLASWAGVTPGTGIATALAVNVGTAGAPVINGGALGTPSSGTLTSATGLPVSTGISGLGTGVATFLATPSSANLAAAITDEAGSDKLVFSAGTLAVASGKTLTASNTLTLTATDGSTLAIGTGGTLASAAYKATGTSGNTVPLLDGANTHSGATVFTGLDGTTSAAVTISNATPVFMMYESDAAADEKYWRILANAGDLALSGINDAFTVAFSPIVIARTGTTATNITLTATAITIAGEMTLPSTGPTSTLSAGFRGIPQRLVSGTTTLLLADAGGWVMMATGSGSQTITIPPNSSVAFPIGTAIVIGNRQDSNAITIVEGVGVTLRRGDATAGTGTRTQTTNAFTTLYKNDTNDWFITGSFT